MFEPFLIKNLFLITGFAENWSTNDEKIRKSANLYGAIEFIIGIETLLSRCYLQYQYQ